MRKIRRLGRHNQKWMPQYQPIYASAETSRDRACQVFEEVDVRKWGQLCMHCTVAVPTSKVELVKLEAEFGLSQGFPEGRRLDLALAHEKITGHALSPHHRNVIITAMRTVDENSRITPQTPEIAAEILKGRFFQAMLTLDYVSLVRLIPHLRKHASNHPTLLQI